jgi:hypothetical protein
MFYTLISPREMPRAPEEPDAKLAAGAGH